MNATILKVIPRSFRAKGCLVTLTIFVRALLNFVGLAALLPVLYLILDIEAIHTNPIAQRVYDYFGFTSDTAFVVAVAVAMVGFIIVKNLLGLGLYRVERDYIYALYKYLSRNLYIDYFNRGLSFIKSSNSAVLARNVNVVCYTFVAGVLRPIASILSEAILFLMLFITITIYSPLAAALSIGIFIPTIWLYFTLVRQRVNQYGRIENEAQRQKYRNVIETYRGYADIEINNGFGSMLESFDRNIDTVVSVGAKNATVATLPHTITEVGLAAGMALLVSLSVWMNDSDMKMLFGVFAVAALRLLPSIRAIMAAWTSLRYNRYTIAIICDAAIDTQREVERTSDERFDFRHEIRVEGLSFRFDDSNQDTLHDLSFTITKGERVGINGRSGAGKTTLFNLLLGLYRPTSGSIRIDGETLSEENRRKWQNTIGYVSQSVFLTDSTLLANITLGSRPEQIDMERVKRAVRMASLDEFVNSLPNGLESRIGECGALLSGGQRQRIGIARALYKRANVLFFDEATSALDNETEQSINQSIEALSQADTTLTIVVIAHRESSLSYCNRIITLK
ncbi:MAG: ABC transporter ATP-binding protein [Alistipes sp.]|jgi:ABC-type bacteriocin/lantibiotic exporter with double-glycine peptidase domain|nr:ABC transporter ATP-binding protein [Alistipes sp.]